MGEKTISCREHQWYKACAEHTSERKCQYYPGKSKKSIGNSHKNKIKRATKITRNQSPWDPAGPTTVERDVGLG
jgi:hypothetical protein